MTKKKDKNGHVKKLLSQMHTHILFSVMHNGTISCFFLEKWR